ncbi:MAG: hypothetical protein EAY75_15000 [Bacteroidetes bacterium]|nr:MAG: hypothetical protein EAY75_15000 [Bacteroidota bacterium]
MAFNSREYEWADVTLVLGGRDLTGIRGVKYSEKIEREPLYAKGRYPHSIQSGNISYEGEMTVLQSEMEALVKAGNGSMLALKGLTAVVSYGSAQAGDAVLNDRIEGIYFTETPKELKQGDKMMEVTLPFVAVRVLRQV